MIIEKDNLKYAEWWNRVITDSELLELRYNIKGMFVWRPYGFALMKNLNNEWDSLFAKNRIKETYFPLLVPVEYAEKNKSWWNSFKEQAFYALGYLENEKKVFLRPTGEPAMYPMFKLWIRSHRDLPLRIYETVSSFRSETKSTKALVRDVEIGPWYEIHTCHATKEEAEKEIQLGIKMNEHLYNVLAIYPLKVRKPVADCFPGSVGAVEFYTLMNDSVVENGSCNNLGQTYAKAFNIQFVNDRQKKDYVWQTCTGNGERFLSAVIANHADEKGLVIPPLLASIRASLVLIKLKKKEMNEKIDMGLNEDEFELVETDTIAELGEARYSNERKGIPVRIEIGPKELAEKKAHLLWRTGKKELVAISKIKDNLKKGLDAMQVELLEKTRKELEKRIKPCKNYDEAKKAEIALIGWCGSEKCSGWIKSKTEKEIIGMTLEAKIMPCIECKKKGEAIYVSKSY
ncbi:hypothetical protein J4217_05040 [Candidatus Pacearchaeota archaeon]|nr:hypothetical protein [Candidatus Pacearchaeota archaeon]